LTGFNLAVGLGGIHALQCVSGSGLGRQVSAWLGDPSNGPRTERLGRVTTSGQTMVIDMGFDVRHNPAFLLLPSNLSFPPAN
jgi:small ligand-binding sensory domain FIST